MTMNNFNDVFYENKNHKTGFIKLFQDYKPLDLVSMLDDFTTDEYKLLDLKLKSLIGINKLSPLSENIINEYASIEDIQKAFIDFLITNSKNKIVTIKAYLNKAIDIVNGKLIMINKSSDNDLNTNISAFNSDELENDRENHTVYEYDETKTENYNDTIQIIKNIKSLIKYKKDYDIIDVFMNEIKELFTLQVL